jgi:hypothetical protein
MQKKVYYYIKLNTFFNYRILIKLGLKTKIRINNYYEI